MAPWALWAGGAFEVLWVPFLAVMEPSSEGLHVSCPSSFHLPLPLLARRQVLLLLSQLFLSLYM